MFDILSTIDIRMDYFHPHLSGFLHTWTLCSLSRAVSGDGFPMPFLHWQMNMAEKLSGKSNSSGVTTIPTLIFHIHSERKGEHLTAFPARRDTATRLCRVKLTFLLSASQDEYKQKSVSAFHYHLWPSLRLGETNIKTEQGWRRNGICFPLPPHKLISLFAPVVLSLCWRLRVLCMEIKCLLCQLCPLRKTDGIF